MRFLRFCFALVILAVLIGGPYCYLSYLRNNFRNFHAVRERVLYRSGQLSFYGLRRAIFEYGIKTVVTLRYSKNPPQDPPDIAEENYCKSASVNYYRIPYRPWWAPDGSVPADQGVKTFLKVMEDPANYPVLVHCFAGIHRTGAYCALYRMEFENWSNEDAIQEMRLLGYTEEHPDVLDYLESYGREKPPLSTPTIRPASHHAEREAMSQ